MRKIIFILLTYFLSFEVKSNTLQQQVKQKVHEWIAKDSLHKNFKVVVDPFANAFENKKFDKIELVNLNVRSSSNRFFAQFSFDGNPKLITGHLQVPCKVPVLTRALSGGEVIKESDVAYKEIDSAKIGPSIVADKEKLIGKAVKRGTLRANSTIRLNQIENPAAIKRGDRVQIMFKTASLVISNIGVAKEDGSLGQVIGFEVGNSEDNKSAKKKIIHGRIVGPNQAEILKAS